MLDNLIILDFSSVKCFRLLNIVVFFTSTMEALNLMLRHRKTFSRDIWHIQSETHHGLIALRVEFLVVSRLYISEFRNTFVLGLDEWVKRDGRLQIIS